MARSPMTAAAALTVPLALAAAAFARPAPALAAENPPVASQGAAPAEIRILTYNIHHGEGLDGKLDLGRLAGIIRAAKPDLVALQEVDRNTTRTGKVDQAAELARLTGLHAVFGKAMDYGGGAYGQAILSVMPPSPAVVHRLPGTGEPRIAVETSVTTSSGVALRMISVHLDHQQPERRLKQAEALRDALQSISGPVVLAGDFNDGPDSPALQTFTASGWTAVEKTGSGLTCPADRPRAGIDHLLIRGGLTAAGPAVVIAEAIASDHRPVSGTVTASPSPAPGTPAAPSSPAVPAAGPAPGNP